DGRRGGAAVGVDAVKRAARRRGAVIDQSGGGIAQRVVVDVDRAGHGAGQLDSAERARGGGVPDHAANRVVVQVDGRGDGRDGGADDALTLSAAPAGPGDHAVARDVDRTRAAGIADPLEDGGGVG